jgi:hypothetical protein
VTPTTDACALSFEWGTAPGTRMRLEARGCLKARCHQPNSAPVSLRCPRLLASGAQTPPAVRSCTLAIAAGGVLQLRGGCLKLIWQHFD